MYTCSPRHRPTGSPRCPPNEHHACVDCDSVRGAREQRSVRQHRREEAVRPLLRSRLCHEGIAGGEFL